MEDYERILLIKQDVFIYKIPPRTTNRAHRAADWKLDEPDWNGRMRLVTKGKELTLKLEDKMSGELFAKCPIDAYPGIAIEAVSDSSRYFVIRLQDDNGRNAFIGLGFSDRGDSFDLNVSLQDHFKLIQKEEEIENEPEKEQPKLDLGFKEGQTIKVNLNIKKTGNSSSNRPKAKVALGGGTGILPPPPGAIKIAPPTSTTTKLNANVSSPTSNTTSQSQQQSSNANDLLDLDIGELNINSNDSSDNKANNENKTDVWSDFASAGGQSAAKTKTNDSWAQF